MMPRSDLRKSALRYIETCKERCYGTRGASYVQEGDYGTWDQWVDALVEFAEYSADGHAMRVLKNHIRRLEARNAALAEMLAEERLLRKKAWTTYWQKLQDGFLNILSRCLDMQIGETAAKRRFDNDSR